MHQIKRSSDDLVDENNNNKKLKSLDESFVEAKNSHLGDLPNEIIYQIFSYLGIYDIYSAFFSFNHRFQHLILNSTSSLQVHVPNISKTDFQFYCANVILPNRERINYLHLSNPFTFNQLFYAPHLLSGFQQLETLILENIDIKYLSLSFRYLSTFKHLRSLRLSFSNTVSHANDIFQYIFNLPYLKSCHLTYQTKQDQALLINLSEREYHSIEKLVLNARIRVESLRDLLLRLPKLRYLSVDSLVGSELSVVNPSMIALKDLRYVSIKLDGISFLHLIQLGKACFHSVRTFYVTIRSSYSFFQPQQWQDFLQTCLPNLEIFDLNYTNNLNKDSSFLHFTFSCHGNCFSSSKNWFFTHQHDNREEEKPAMMLYSTEPYRRKEFSIYGETCRSPSHSIIQYDSVKYLQIYSKQSTDFSYYFPNVIELKLGTHFPSLFDTLQQVFPLEQLQILHIAHWVFPLDDLVHLLFLAPKLHTLKMQCFSTHSTNLSLLELSPYFQSVIETNQVKSFHLNHLCTLEMVKVVLKLFPRIEDLKFEMYTGEICAILKYLFPKTNPPNRHLKCLGLTRTPKRCLKELDNFIKAHNLLKNYSIKILNRQLYLWW